MFATSSQVLRKSERLLNHFFTPWLVLNYFIKIFVAFTQNQFWSSLLSLLQFILPKEMWIPCRVFNDSVTKDIFFFWVIFMFWISYCNKLIFIVMQAQKCSVWHWVNYKNHCILYILSQKKGKNGAYTPLDLIFS